MSKRSIPKKVPKDIEFGTYTSKCDYCGAVFYRHQLQRDRAGLLFCPDEGEGLDKVLLTELNAQGAEEHQVQHGPNDSGFRVHSDDTVTPLEDVLPGGTTF